jgi:mono/diheme cytochrome c family protein
MKKYYIVFLFALSAGLSGCYHDKEDPGYEYAPQMYYPVAYDPDKPNPVFADGKTAQKPPEGSIPRGFETFDYPNTPEAYERAGAELKNPVPLNDKTLAEGKQLFQNMCSHCHGMEGKADGAIVAAGKFPPPPAYNSDKLKDLPEGKMFFSITYGKNLMGPHASILSKEERWKIIHYIQTLQKLQ